MAQNSPGGIYFSTKEVQPLGVSSFRHGSLLALCLPLVCCCDYQRVQGGCVYKYSKPFEGPKYFLSPLFAVRCKEAGVCRKVLIGSNMALFNGRATQEGTIGARMFTGAWEVSDTSSTWIPRF